MDGVLLVTVGSGVGVSEVALMMVDIELGVADAVLVGSRAELGEEVDPGVNGWFSRFGMSDDRHRI